MVDTANIKFDHRLRTMLEIMASQGITRAAQGFSSMTGTELGVNEPSVNMVPLMEIPELLGGPENDAVGIYLRVHGDLPGQIMLILSIEKATELVDLMMDNPPGTTQELGVLERSALAELGNLTGTFFLNALADLTGYRAMPSPPAVMVDMVGAILDILIASWGGVSDHVLMFTTTFMNGERNTEANFWMLPDTGALEAFARRIEANHG